MEKKRLRSIFNGLSKADRFKLKGAALSKAISGVIRDDTQSSPAKYPLYLGYLLCVGTPIVPGGVLLLAATGIWLKKSKSKLANETNSRIKDSFNKESLIKDHMRYIKEDNKNKGKFKINNDIHLVWGTTKVIWKDTLKATHYAMKALKNQFI